MTAPIDSRYAPHAKAALRIVAGLAFFSHGAAKLFGWFGGVGPDGGTVELMSRFGAAGVIETVFGLMIAIGLFTRIAAFISSGQMAVTYFWMHAAKNSSIFWWENRGETALLFCFIFLFFAVAGAGIWSVDAMRARRETTS